jgi:hypothetical protein
VVDLECNDPETILLVEDAVALVLFDHGCGPVGLELLIKAD